jgi:hypothetical protein
MVLWKEIYKMKKIIFVVILVLFSKAYAKSSGPGPGWGMEIDPESLGVTANGKFFTESLNGSGGLSWLGVGGIESMEIPRDFSISNERPFHMNEYSREMGAGGF